MERPGTNGASLEPIDLHYDEADPKWMEIEERIIRCAEYADRADSAIVKLDSSLRLMVYPNSPIEYVVDDGTEIGYTTESFILVEASMRLKSDGEWHKPLMIGSQDDSSSPRVVQYRFNPFQHNITAWQVEGPENPLRPSDGIHVVTTKKNRVTKKGRALMLTVY